MKKKPSLLTLLLLMPFASIAAVLFTPALPAIAILFQISEGAAASAMSVFLVGYALGNLPYGPIAKRYGRKPAIYFGAALTIFSSLLIVAAGRYQLWNLFLIGRFLSALGSSVGMKIAFTIIGDAFEKEEATKTVSLATLAFAIAPGLSVALGGYLTVAFGWESCFYAIALYSALILALSFPLPETALQLDPHALNPSAIVSTYRQKFKNKTLVYCALILGCVTSLIYLFSTIAPFLVINGLHVSPEHYGLLNFIPPLGLIGGSFTSHWLSSRKPKREVIAKGALICTAILLIMLFLFLTFQFSIWTLFIPITALYFGTSLIFNNASSLAMEHVKDKSNGSAIMGFINVSFAAIAVFIGESISSPSPIVLTLIFLCIVLAIFILNHRLKSA